MSTLYQQSAAGFEKTQMYLHGNKLVALLLKTLQNVHDLSVWVAKRQHAVACWEHQQTVPKPSPTFC